MAVRCTFQKHHFDYSMHECFFCRNKPTGFLTDLWTFEEVRSCESCFLMKKKTRKTARVMEIINSNKIAQNSQITRGKKEKQSILRGNQ